MRPAAAKELDLLVKVGLCADARAVAQSTQPTAFLGRLEAIRAPTSGKARKKAPPTRPPTPRSALQLLGRSALRARNHSGIVATNMVKVRPASDQASHAEARVFALAPTRSRLLVPSVTPLLYSTTVAQALRQTLRGSSSERRSAELTKIHFPIEQAMYACIREMGCGFFEGVCEPSNEIANICDSPPPPTQENRSPIGRAPSRRGSLATLPTSSSASTWIGGWQSSVCKFQRT